MNPLIYTQINEENIIKKIDGKPEIKQHLKDMGFNVGSNIKVISSIDGNLIVSVKGTKIALDRKLAMKIYV